MFDTLTGRLDAIFKKLRSRGKLHPKQVENALADMRVALLDADVAVEVADDLLARVRERALSEEVMQSLTPAQQVVKVVRDELQETMGGTQAAFVLPQARPAVVMMAGVQGSGKTTATAKLALMLKSKGKRPLLVAADLWRPAAVEQLVTLGGEIGVDVVSDGKDAVKVAKNALKQAGKDGFDVMIVDTAGRLHVDDEMMREARRVKDAISPHQVLMACDAMTGQDAVVQARAFMAEVDTTGFVLTKLDGDARGGAALSITSVTGRPVFFVGTGERPGDLEPFYPDRMASRVMGMGDVLSLIDKAQGTVDQEKAAEAAERMMSARFTLEDFLVQMQEVRKLGPLQDLLAMLPGVPGGKNALKDLEVDEGQIVRAQAIIQSMTTEERRNPAIIGGSRRLRIARGSGVTTADVNSLLKEFDQARKMMKSMLGGTKMPRIPGMPNITG
ncbi:MAG TPA: signal recognition particle protein [Actinomycetota bacterium]|jgi:signal recognition particle subunit SRP54|nr:signal recognition particle protein [Actinomycetota bacterium]HEX5904318.1 signal recognition particle protein [Actinomycetota bacterium]